jgi:phosphate/sulfate permease
MVIRGLIGALLGPPSWTMGLSPFHHVVPTQPSRVLPIDGFASQTASTAVIIASSYAGAPVSTTHVVASSVIGIGVGRRHPREPDAAGSSQQLARA